VLALPGAALVRRDEWERGEPIEIVAVAFAASAAFWATAFWGLKFAPLGLRPAAVAVLAGALVALPLRRQALTLALKAWRREPGPAVAGTLFLLAVVVLRLAFAARHIGFSGGDMTAHAALSEMIVLSDGFPASQEPLLPVSRFGQVAPGFHAVSALVSLLSGAPTYRSTIFVLCAAAAALTFSLYALLRALKIARWPAAFGAAGALVLARNPQFFAQWGGAPSLLSAAVGFLLLRDALSLGERCDTGFLARSALLSAGMLLIHPLPAVGFVYVFAACALALLTSGRGSWKRFAVNGAIVAATGLLLAAPFLLAAPRTVSPNLALWARGWFREETQRALFLERRFFPARGKEPGALTWPFFLAVYLGVLPAVLLFTGLLKRWWKDRGEATAVATAVVCACFVLFAGALGAFLPLWPALYPSRTALWLAVPMAVALAGLVPATKRLPLWAAIFFAADLTAAFAFEGRQLSRLEFGSAFYEEAKAGRASALKVAAHEAAGGAFWVATLSRDNSALTQDDVAAFEWIRGHTPESAVFANNPGDGGGLVPAAAHRKIFDPHFYWFFDESEMAAWRAKAPVNYVYVGARPSPAWPRRWRCELLEKDPGVEEVFRSGPARVFRVKNPLDPRFR
jgi:hypothetical protein